MFAVQQTAEGGQGRLMVGLTGYPNVGKSSTINALFGSKKTAVAATPGKTKHFQTLNITERMTLCDCPGLVLPKFAASKAEMVAAGETPHGMGVHLYTGNNDWRSFILEVSMLPDATRRPACAEQTWSR